MTFRELVERIERLEETVYQERELKDGDNKWRPEKSILHKLTDAMSGQYIVRIEWRNGYVETGRIVEVRSAVGLDNEMRLTKIKLQDVFSSGSKSYNADGIVSVEQVIIEEDDDELCESPDQEMLDLLRKAENAGERAAVTFKSGEAVTGVPRLTKDFVIVEHHWYLLSDITGIVVFTGETTVTPKPPDMSRQAEMIKENMNWYGVSGVVGLIRGATCCSLCDAELAGIHPKIGVEAIKLILEELWRTAHSE